MIRFKIIIINYNELKLILIIKNILINLNKSFRMKKINRNIKINDINIFKNRFKIIIIIINYNELKLILFIYNNIIINLNKSFRRTIINGNIKINDIIIFKNRFKIIIIIIIIVIIISIINYNEWKLILIIIKIN